MSSFDPLNDIGKKPSDLFKLNFPKGIFKVSTETSTDTGFKIKSEISSAYLKKDSKSERKNEVEGKVKPEYDLKEFNTVVKGELDTNNSGKINIIVSDLILPRSKIDVSLSQEANSETFSTKTDSEVNLIFYHEKYLALKLGAVYNYEKKEQPRLKGQAVLQFPDNLYWSVAPEVPYGNKNDFKLDAKVTYVQPSYEFLFNIKHDNKEDETTYSTSWYQKLQANLKYATNFSTTLGEGASRTSADIGAEYTASDVTTLKAKTSTTSDGRDTQQRTGLSLIQKVSPGCTFTFGVDLNTRHLLNNNKGVGSPHAFGFEVKLS